MTRARAPHDAHRYQEAEPARPARPGRRRRTGRRFPPDRATSDHGPFCRTPDEADRVLEVMAEHGLGRGEGGLQLYMMCEIPSNVILAEEFAKRFDGFSIGSNDLTQLVLGVDRDSAELAALFDERDEAVKRMIREAIRKAHETGTKVGICGQAPSNYPEFAEFLVEEGIDSISLNPDSFIETAHHVAAVEKRLR